MIALVHGLGLSHRYFARLSPLLPGATAVDLEGGTVSAMADALARAIEPGSLLVANSLGAQVAVELAAREPASASALILTGPTWDPAAPSVRAQLGRLLLDATREPFSVVPVVLADYARTGPVAMLQATREMLRHAVIDRLALVRVPVVVMRGSRDPICTQGWAGRLAATAPHGRLVVVPGAAHALEWSHPAVIARVALELAQGASVLSDSLD